MGHFIFSFFGNALKHIGSLFEHIHLPEWIFPRAFAQIVRTTYNEHQIFWNIVGGCILVLLAGAFLLWLYKKITNSGKSTQG